MESFYYSQPQISPPYSSSTLRIPVIPSNSANSSETLLANTLADLASPQSLSNKTIVSPTITGTITVTGTTLAGLSSGTCANEVSLDSGGHLITSACGGGGGVPGGSPGQVQWNNSGSFGGSSGLTLSSTQLTSAVMGLGSDATGDVYYRNSGGNLTRLGIGSAAQVLTVSGGLPSWANATGGGNFSGPGSAVSGNLVSFNGTSGTLGQDSGVASANVVTASGTLTSNALMLGGSSKSAGVIGSLGTTTTVLHGNAAGAPTFGAVTLTTDVSGLLPVANGGTGIGTLLAGTVPMGAGTSPLVASEITDVASGGVVIGSPTGGQKGAGTINMTGCFINNVACGSGGSVTSVGLSVPATSILSVTGSPVTTAGVLALATTGTSGGIPYFSSTSQLASSGLLGANLPLFGGGAGASPIAGTRSGNTTEVGTVSGALTSGNCVKSDASGNLVDAATTCGGGGTPVAFTSVATGSANTYAMTTTPSSGFSLANSPLVCGPISATNTGASTLNVNAGGAVAIDKQTITGLSALVGGEMVASNTTYCFQYNVAATAWVLQTQLASNVVNNATSATVTAAQWANGTVFNVTTAAQTITLPVATSLSPLGGIFVNAIGNSVTIAPNAADGINGGSIGAGVTVSSGVGAWVFTVGSSGTGALTANPLTGGSGGGLTVGTTTIASGTANGLLFDSAGVLGNLATVNNGVLVTSSGGVPSISTTLPASLTIPGYATTATLTANTMVKATGAGAIANASITDNGTLVNATAEPLSVSQAYSVPSALTDGATIAVNALLSNNFTVTIAGNRTLSNPTNLVAGQILNFQITQDATGSRTLAFGVNYNGAITLNPAANSVTLFSCYASSSSSLQCAGGAPNNITASNCSSGASPAVCGSARAGSVAVPTGATPTLVVNSSAVTANSQILLTIDESATIGGTTCNTTLATLVQPIVTARSAGTSFTMQINATLATNPACVDYFILN